MKRMAMVIGLVTIGAAAAWAQSDVIAQRQALMKEMGGQLRATSGMLREQNTFNLQTVQTALKTFSQDSKRALALFPAGSDKGDTKATAAVWEKKAEFDGLFDKFDKDAQAALAAITDEASFKQNFPKVIENCGTCHKNFRKS